MHTTPVPADNNPLESGYWGIQAASDNLIISCNTDAESRRYLVIVNKNVNEARDVFLQFEDDTNLAQIPEMTLLASKDGKICFTMAPGGGKLFEIAK